MVGKPGAQESFMAWNEEMARKYDPEAYHLRSNPLIRWIERRRVKTVATLLAARDQDQILEVGCGAGNVLEAVHRGQLVGIDLSVFLLNKARRRLVDRGVALCLANGEFLPFGDNRFEKLLCTEVLEHTLNPRAFVQEMVRVVKPGGTVVISVPNEPLIDRLKDSAVARALATSRVSLSSRNGYRYPERMTDEWHLHAFDLRMLEDTVRGLLQKSQVRGVPLGFLPLRHVLSGEPLV
jgi:ubiquinone/menaquinone biosynthesis C-methylase UbiE